MRSRENRKDDRTTAMHSHALIADQNAWRSAESSDAPQDRPPPSCTRPTGFACRSSPTRLGSTSSSARAAFGLEARTLAPALPLARLTEREDEERLGRPELVRSPRRDLASGDRPTTRPPASCACVTWGTFVARTSAWVSRCRCTNARASAGVAVLGRADGVQVTYGRSRCSTPRTSLRTRASDSRWRFDHAIASAVGGLTPAGTPPPTRGLPRLRQNGTRRAWTPPARKREQRRRWRPS